MFEIHKNDLRRSFGQSVAYDGRTLVVGADDTSMHGTKECGAAYVYDDSRGIIDPDNEIVIYHPVNHSFFGWSVAVHDDIIVIGADDEGFFCNGLDMQFPYLGAAYIWERNSNGTFHPLQKLLPKFGGDNCVMSGRYFGYQVVTNGRHVVVSSPCYQTDAKKKKRNMTPFCSTPSIEIYARSGSTFEHATSIFGPAMSPSYGELMSPPLRYGMTICMNGRYLAVSNYNHGKIELYEVFDDFRKSAEVPVRATHMAMHDSFIVAGDYMNNCVTAYDVINKKTMVIGPHVVPQLQPYCFGYRVAIGDDRVAVSSVSRLASGMFLYDNVVSECRPSGSVYVYKRDREGFPDVSSAQCVYNGFVQSMAFDRSDGIFLGCPNDPGGGSLVYLEKDEKHRRCR